MSYPGWIDEYARSNHQLVANVVPGSWSSLDGWAAFAAYEGAFLSRIRELMEVHRKAETSSKDLWNMFSNPSSLRWAFYGLVSEYSAISDKSAHKKSARQVFEWLHDILASGMRDDVWAFERNIIHGKEEVAQLLGSTPWIEDDMRSVREAGKIYTSAAALAFALYQDIFPQDAHEVYGPYDASSRFGEGASLIIKHFRKIRPVELWSEVSSSPYEEVKIYHALKGARFSCEFIGMHSKYDAPVVPHTVAVAVEADGHFASAADLAGIADSIAGYATEYSSLYQTLDITAAKRKFAEWEAYQFVKLFEAAGMDWRPTDAMLAPLMAADIPMGFSLDSFPPYEEFATSPEYEIYWLKDLYSSG